VTVNGVKPDTEPGARYTCLPILLITAILIVAVDSKFMDQARWRPASVVAVAGLIAVLCVGWIPDFRYAAGRTMAPAWAPKLSRWLDTCQHADAIHYYDSLNNTTSVIPCSRIHS
jgi:hypothetical protein